MVGMLGISFLTWWYGQGWIRIIKALPGRLQAITKLFSVSTLLKTMFAPWRRTVSYPGRSLGEHFQAWGNNLVSRFVGFFVRIFVLLAAAVSAAIVVCFGLIALIVWPFMPFAAVFLLVKGIIG